MEFSLLTFQTTVLGLLLVACLSAIALRKLHFPYTIGLVIIGLVLGFGAEAIPGLEMLTDLNLSHEAILFLFLPPLIFESALNLNARLLLRNITPVLVLATAGLLMATAVVSALMAWLTPLSWQESLLFGALISATDPVAVIALFKELGVPNQLVVLVEGESLFNDATAIVTFNLILAAAAMETENLAVAGLTEFFSSFLGGILVGVSLAWLMSYLIVAARRSPFIQGTLTAILAFGTFILADHNLHVSGVIAVVSAGIVTSWIISSQLKPDSREFLNELWEYLSFLTNSLIFLLVGLASAQVLQEVEDLRVLMLALGVAIAAVLVSRALAIFTLIPLVNRVHTAPPIARGEQTILLWGGLRGAVGLALALSLENEIENGHFVVALTLGVALFTLLIPGTTMGHLINYLGLNKASVMDELETAEALITANNRALTALEGLSMEGEQYEDEIAHIKDGIEQALTRADTKLNEVWTGMNTDRTQLAEATWLQALTIEQQIYRQLHDDGILSAAAFTRLNLGISARQSEIVAEQLPPTPLGTRVLTTRIEMQGTRLLKRLLPKRAWRDRAHLEQFSAMYECDLAIEQVTHQVIQRLVRLPQRCRSDKDLFRSCLKYYREGHRAAQKRIEHSAKQHPDAAHKFERHIAQRVAASGRERAVEALLNNGVISTSVAKTVCEQFELSA
ncbi:MAG: sodium:proton antiporter [Cyanobacteria bacterium J06634_5]